MNGTNVECMGQAIHSKVYLGGEGQKLKLHGPLYDIRDFSNSYGLFLASVAVWEPSVNRR